MGDKNAYIYLRIVSVAESENQYTETRLLSAESVEALLVTVSFRF